MEDVENTNLNSNQSYQSCTFPLHFLKGFFCSPYSLTYSFHFRFKACKLPLSSSAFFGERISQLTENSIFVMNTNHYV